MREREHNLVAERKKWKRRLYHIIYRADTPLGQLFDIVLLCCIILSTITVLAESVPAYDKKIHIYLVILEWVLSIGFTVEYILRILVVRNKKDYILSFFGIVDLLALLPFFLSLIFPVTKYFLILRMLRILRIFRIFNLLDFMNDGYLIVKALKNSARKIYIFLLFLIIFTTIVGSLMFMVEGGRPGFESIPQCIYWAVVTVTTVGYGDVSPITPLGKFFATILMLSGYSIIAVPTGIVTAEMRYKKKDNERACSRCGNDDVDNDARYCKRCGEKLPDPELIPKEHHNILN